MHILGVSCYDHDAAAEEERFSRIKHDYCYPKNAIRICLKQGDIKGADLN
jgi:carbamoyltransferase